MAALRVVVLTSTPWRIWPLTPEEKHAALVKLGQHVILGNLGQYVPISQTGLLTRTGAGVRAALLQSILDNLAKPDGEIITL